jgi:hypothetical protein
MPLCRLASAHEVERWLAQHTRERLADTMLDVLGSLTGASTEREGAEWSRA